MKLSAWAWAVPVVGLAAAASVGLAGKADAARLENPVAEFAGIDKITGRITTFDEAAALAEIRDRIDSLKRRNADLFAVAEAIAAAIP